MEGQWISATVSGGAHTNRGSSLSEESVDNVSMLHKLHSTLIREKKFL